MNAHSLRQTLAVVRLEIRKTFFARRGLWVYLLAFAPVLLYVGHSIYAPRERARLARVAAAHPIPASALRSIREGQTMDQVVARLGEPYYRRTGQRRGEGGRLVQYAQYRYTDGATDYSFRFMDGEVTRIGRSAPDTLDQNSRIFATIFQFYYLRLAVFFGCAGVFMNLFRGEMLDKSLHFYLLTPVRREMLMAGKFIAGLAATVVIFTISAALQWAAMLAQFRGQDVASVQGQLGSYLGVTALACIGYGSIFLAAGLLFRNPIIPAAGVLFWESVNLFVPEALKQFSLIFYLQSLCPIVAAPDSDMSLPLKLLIASAEPAAAVRSIATVLILTIAVLGFAAVQSRRLEINYSTD